jgi:hypothetical protein
MLANFQLRWLIFSLVILFLLAACGGNSDQAALPVDGEGDTAVSPNSTEPITENAQDEDETTTVTEENEDTAVTNNSPLILTEDDRSNQLRQLTSSWNTNWSLHTIDYADILSGGPPRDGIPSLDNPTFVPIAQANEWLADNEPVVVLEINGDARAYPIQVLTWHEIANDTVGDLPVVVTFCPLCNSAIVFERIIDGNPVEFGVSGLLRNSDLIMYDRTDESLWQQFTGEGIVGNHAGKQLAFLPSSLVSYADFKAGFPEGVVLSRETGFSRPYGENPYAGYDTYDNPLSSGGNLALFSGHEDNRLAPADRVVTLSVNGVDMAYPLAILSEAGVIHDAPGGVDLVVFHTGGTSSALGARVIADAEDVGATGVFDPTVDGQQLTFRPIAGGFEDAETSSTWTILGQAMDGPLAGSQLTPIVHADHFWFSWAAFKPDTIIYQP